MKLRVFLFLLLGIAAVSLARAEAPSTALTMRVDYYHTGKAGADEVFALDRVVVEPLPWAGNPKRPLDDTGLGEYFFEVIDRATQTPLYSRGFSTWFDAWESTPAARGQYRTFQESIRFPEPKKPVIVRVRRRDRANDFKELWSFAIDPADSIVARGTSPSPGKVIEIQKKGPSSRKLDLLFLGDGYTAKERDKFVADARRLTENLFEHEPFRAHRADFNVWALATAAQDPGVSRPSAAIDRDSPLGTTYDALGVATYLATFSDRQVRAMASNAPYDALVILVNSEVYGGSGIFNNAAVVAAQSPWAPFLLAHNLGQSLAALAVENFTWDWASPGGGFFSYSEPWQKNITLEDDAAAVKWHELVTPGLTGETPWKDDDYKSFGRGFRDRERAMRAEHRPESDLDALRREEKERSTELLADTKPEAAEENAEADEEESDEEPRSTAPAEPVAPAAPIVGVFEGANHDDDIYNRSQLDCVMFSRNDVDFCAVCRHELETVILLYAK
ncbi:MAG TPA: M64 family metallopeptidase [Thermoanaerobaculia bacterium]|jgi:hypothetical protein|nr:M64 family metallopeptidase [Thermoanaerobaculia bacterium]